MHSAQMNPRNTEHRVSERLKLNRRAGLNSVGIFRALIKSHDGSVLKKPAASQRATGTKWSGRSVRISPLCQQRIQSQEVDIRAARKTEQSGSRIQLVLKIPAGKRRKTSTRGRLAHKQRRRNNPVKQAKSSAKHHVSRCPQVVGDAHARIEVVPLRVQNARRPGFKFPA